MREVARLLKSGSRIALADFIFTDDCVKDLAPFRGGQVADYGQTGSRAGRGQVDEKRPTLRCECLPIYLSDMSAVLGSSDLKCASHGSGTERLVFKATSPITRKSPEFRCRE